MRMELLHGLSRSTIFCILTYLMFLLRRVTAVSLSRCFSLNQLQRLNPHPSIPEPLAFNPAEPSPDDEIIVAMSSGVDSSVTAALYAAKYKNVRGIYMANWSQTAKCTESDWNDVQKVCDHIGIPCERVNFEKEYWTDVFTPMIDMYSRGLTPNPDLGCNKYVKFGKMIEHLSEKLDSKWWLATGHYARVQSGEEARLLRAYDGNKDQSYYLANIPSKVLSRVLMPLGHYTKPQVRQMAAEFDLHTASKPDSQGLCFVNPDHTKFRDFLNEYILPNPGNIITEDGKIWGRHDGLWHATIGQKLGISMPQGSPEYKGIWFVSEKRVATNELVIVRGRDNDRLFKLAVKVDSWEWMGNGEESTDSDELFIQYRSLQDPVKVRNIEVHGNTVTFGLEENQRAMAPGQSVVLYDGYRVVGSGTLTEAFNM